MALSVSPLLATPQSGQPDSRSWRPEMGQVQRAHSVDNYDRMVLSTAESERHLSTQSSTAYEPSYLESGSAKQRSLPRLFPARLPTSLWTLEIIAIIISTGAVISIIALLHRENGKALTGWTLAVTLNTVVAALGTLARTTLAFALSACIGQQKWNWLRRKPDELVAWERFDEASRGPWGATRLFVWLRARHWAALGALVTVGAIAFDPFLQAVISTHGQLDSILVNSDATIGQSIRIHSGLVQPINGAAMALTTSTGQFNHYMNIMSRPDFGFISSVYSGFQNTSTFRSDAIGAECSTGNCTWPVFTSAAICSSCKDVTDQMKRVKLFGTNGTNIPSVNNRWSGDYIKFELPYGNIRNYLGHVDALKHNSRAISTYMTANTTIDANRTISFEKMNNLLMAFLVMRSPKDWLDAKIKWEDSTPTATECALYLCANAYESRSENNIVKENILGSWSIRVPGSYGVGRDFDGFDPGDGAEGWIESLGDRLYDLRLARADLQLSIPQDTSIDLPRSALRLFNVSHAFISSAMDFLIDYTKGGNEPRYINPLDKGPLDETWNMMGVPWRTTAMPAVLDTLWESQNLTATFDNVARSLTNQIRNSSPDRHQGELQKWVLHVHVDWAYLAYPIAMLAAGILYVILTIIESTRLRMPVWKESALPTLLHGFDDETQSLLREDAQTARNVRVRFEEDEKECLRLVVQR